MPNLSNKVWKDRDIIKTEDLQRLEDHLIDDISYQQIETNKQDIETLKTKGGGHKILDKNGIELPQQPKMQFVGLGVTKTENVGDTTQVTVEGEKGDAATIQVGTVETVEPNIPASIINVGDENNAVFNFKLPRGKDGEGIGDMLKLVYDKNNDGKVDIAENSEKLGGKLESALNVANAATVNGKTVARNVLIDEYTNEQIDQKTASVYRAKGSVPTYSDLPSSATNGDVYNVIDTGMNYVRIDAQWDSLGTEIDLTNYYTKSQVYNKTESDSITNEIKKVTIKTATISSWSSVAPYTQTISFTGMTPAMTPLIYLEKVGTVDEKKKQISEFGKISEATSGANSIILTCYSSKPTIDLQVAIKGV